MVMAAVGLLAENPHPTEAEVREGLEGNLCRCTGYHNVVRAVLAAAGAGTAEPGTGVPRGAPRPSATAGPRPSTRRWDSPTSSERTPSSWPAGIPCSR